LAAPGRLAWVSDDGRAAIIIPDGRLHVVELYRAGAALVVRADASALCADPDPGSPRPGPPPRLTGDPA
jgi:hypothetical protein